MVLFMASESRLQSSRSSTGIPKGVGAEEGQLAAILDHAADFAHLEPVTQLGENTFVP